MKLKRYLRYQYFKVLRLKDAPAKVAQGFGLGLAMDFVVPIPFVSIFIAFLVAKLVKVNSLAAVLSASAIKPLFAGIVTLNVLTTKHLVSAIPSLKMVSVPIPDTTSYINELLGTILNYGFPYLLAGSLNGIIVGIVSYLLVYNFLRERQKRQYRKVLTKKGDGGSRANDLA